MSNLNFSYDVTRDQDQAYVTKAIGEMDDNFTLILLTDFFDESLIMMKHLLCWDWDDIVYIKFKMRTDDSKAEVTLLTLKNLVLLRFSTVTFFVWYQNPPKTSFLG